MFCSDPRGTIRARFGTGSSAWSYRLDGLLARLGTDAALPDVLMALAVGDRRKDFSRPCGARFSDLVR